MAVHGDSAKWDRLQATVPAGVVLDRADRFEDVLADTVMTVWTEDQRTAALSAMQNNDTSSQYYELMMKDFGAAKHYDMNRTHRMFVDKAFQRFRQWLTALTQEQVAKHDSTKDTQFRQVVG